MTKLAQDGGKSVERSGRAGSTVNCYLAAMKGVAKAAWISGQLAHEDYLRVTAVKELRYSRAPAGRSLTFRESRTMLQNWDPNRKIDIRDQAILMLMLGCGLRRGEIPGLMIERYFPDEGALTLIGKGDKERKVFLPDEVQESIDDWIQRVRGVGPGRLFGRILKNGSLNLSRPLDPRSVGMIVQNRLKASQINGKLTAHDLRRTFATRLLDDGIDITTVKNMMGHANITTTARYDRRGEEVQKRAARSVRLEFGSERPLPLSCRTSLKDVTLLRTCVMTVLSEWRSEPHGTALVRVDDAHPLPGLTSGSLSERFLRIPGCCGISGMGGLLDFKVSR